MRNIQKFHQRIFAGEGCCLWSKSHRLILSGEIFDYPLPNFAECATISLKGAGPKEGGFTMTAGNERAIAECKKNKVSLIFSLIISAVFAIITLVCFFEVIFNGTVEFVFYMMLALIASIVVGLTAWIEYNSVKLVLTESKVIGYRMKKKLIIPIQKVQDIEVENGYWPNSYNLTINSAGTAGNELVFKDMANGDNFADLVLEQIAKVQ